MTAGSAWFVPKAGDCGPRDVGVLSSETSNGMRRSRSTFFSEQRERRGHAHAEVAAHAFHGALGVLVKSEVDERGR